MPAREIQGEPFASIVGIGPLDHFDAACPRDIGRRVRAIIGDDENSSAGPGGIAKAFQTGFEDRFLVVGRNHDDHIARDRGRVTAAQGAEPCEDFDCEAKGQDRKRRKEERYKQGHQPSLSAFRDIRDEPAGPQRVPNEDARNLRQRNGRLSVLTGTSERSWVKFESPASLVQVAAPVSRRFLTPGNLLFALGCALLLVPTMLQVARDTWSTEQGGHGPLVLATGLWALWREAKGRKVELRPGKLLPSLLMLGASLALFVVARITGVLEVEAFAMYGALIAAAYTLLGGQLIRALWFPLVYLAFTLPPPDTVVTAVTQPIKIAISEWAVSLLYALGYPVASSGVTIQIGQYQLLVAAACAGLNSIVTLTALCLFYVYLRHRSNPIAFVVISLSAIPVAIVSNFVRVLVLVLITYHFGDAAAQGFVHDFAGLLMFAVALLTIFGIDKLAQPLFAKRRVEAK